VRECCAFDVDRCVEGAVGVLDGLLEREEKKKKRPSWN
jgi:hypothetical protein